MNNKGQSLVLFIALLPFIFILFVFVFDLANLATSKSNLDSIAKSAVKYMVVDSKDSLFVTDIVHKNNEEIIIDLIDSNSICLSLDVEPVFGEVIGFDIFKVKSCYTGKYIDNKFVLEKRN